MRITGKEIIAMGYAPGPWMGPALAEIAARNLKGPALDHYLAKTAPPAPVKQPLQDGARVAFNLSVTGPEDEANVAAVRATMETLMRTPTLVAGAVMPDACPAGPPGTIPVGGVAVARNAIHPGMHSADICCSVMVSALDGFLPKALLDAVHQVTHFGPGGRAADPRFVVPGDLAEEMSENRFLNGQKAQTVIQSHFGTQGDGNHFAFVGTSKASGRTCLVTHHGSRGPGAVLYKEGMRVAEEHRRRHAPDTLRQNAWIVADSDAGVAYWEALQLLRRWTKASHAALHDAAIAMLGTTYVERAWNEHNFVFREGDLYHHAKGATPVHDGFLPDTDGVQIVPLNMGAPVLLIKGARTDANLGFAPHGAGRNRSRTAHKRRLAGQSEADIFARETQGLDARFFCGRTDISELPSAYKSADSVRSQMAEFGLAEVVDEIEPYGSIMAGDWQADAPWRMKQKRKRA
ncbi:MAG: RtcB family protein [Pseudomonadota bacterium]